MKHIKLFFALSILGFILNGCLKGPNHSIRITNNYPTTISNVKIGSVSFGTVDYKKTTSYKPVEEGSHTISGNSSSGTLSGTVSVTGKGTHKWTLTILSSGSLDIKEDK